MQEVHKRFRNWVIKHTVTARWSLPSSEVSRLQQEKLVQLLLLSQRSNHMAYLGANANHKKAINRRRVREESHRRLEIREDMIRTWGTGLKFD